MIVLIWLINAVISILNAWGCGKTWNETKHVGGWQHFLNWCGAIMSACGFSWCYGIIFGFMGVSIPIEQDDGSSAPLLTMEMLEAFANLGYLVLIFPILGSGLAITIHSWGVFWRRRSFADGTVTGWNTVAQVYNTASALQNVPDAFGNVADFFSSDSKSDSKRKAVVVLLVIAALLAGCLTTYAIIKATAKSTANARYFEGLSKGYV